MRRLFSSPSLKLVVSIFAIARLRRMRRTRATITIVCHVTWKREARGGRYFFINSIGTRWGLLNDGSPRNIDKYIREKKILTNTQPKMRDLHIHIHMNPIHREEVVGEEETTEEHGDASSPTPAPTPASTSATVPPPPPLPPLSFASATGISLDQLLRHTPNTFSHFLDQMVRRNDAPDFSVTFEPLFPPNLNLMVTNDHNNGMGVRDLQRTTECMVFQHQTNEEQAAICSICRSDLAEGDVVRKIRPCHHIFHQRCIDDWLAINTTCPMCRTNLLLLAAPASTDDGV